MLDVRQTVNRETSGLRTSHSYQKPANDDKYIAHACGREGERDAVSKSSQSWSEQEEDCGNPREDIAISCRQDLDVEYKHQRYRGPKRYLVIDGVPEKSRYPIRSRLYASNGLQMFCL